jgi:hypothetical protein
MKIALGLTMLGLLAAVPVHAQSISMGGGSLTPPSFHILPWTPPADQRAVEVSGSAATYVPSTFLTFDRAVAAGKANLKAQAKTVAQVAAESRKGAKNSAAKIQFAQDGRGRAVLSRN